MKQAGLLCIPKVHSLHGTPSPSRSFQPTPPQQRRFDVEPERCNEYSSLIYRPARRTPVIRDTAFLTDIRYKTQSHLHICKILAPPVSMDDIPAPLSSFP